MLEIDTEPLIKERLQEKIIPIKKYLNENNLKYSNFVISNKFINFNLKNLNDVEKFEKIFFLKEKILLILTSQTIIPMNLISKQIKMRLKLCFQNMVY